MGKDELLIFRFKDGKEIPEPENGHKKGENPCKQGFSPRYFFIKSDVLIWRKREDSNLRYGYPHTRFPSVLLKPLGHTSA